MSDVVSIFTYPHSARAHFSIDAASVNEYIYFSSASAPSTMEMYVRPSFAADVAIQYPASSV